MKNPKVKAAIVGVGAFLSSGLYAYALYSVYYTYKRGNVGEIALYTAIISVCSGIIMLLYTLTDKKRAHSTANKIIVPVITAVVHAAVYLTTAFAVKKSFAAEPGGAVAAGLSCIMFGVALAIFLNGIANCGQRHKR